MAYSERLRQGLFSNRSHALIGLVSGLALMVCAWHLQPDFLPSIVGYTRYFFIVNWIGCSLFVFAAVKIISPNTQNLITPSILAAVLAFTTMLMRLFQLQS